ncbi:RWD domain-containing protein 2A isoform X2 [Dromiciops gliroides]|uniref:RWD domain-containing protein 2A isoform X2 n=1 Tax=Dromiciops gliroides TaxID=33562 RepID=UPI001CC4F079|nr:RWD domain-containing protein 2A isoform X2 [Dromiciops gliroides]XP_043818987.1 RWD domain-containing protein 2A isoform X2 [Dromiciops gliroides]XP_043818988.1 RWD domain-containing protein 2A isoform X2 [Dromiciops gliroides]
MSRASAARDRNVVFNVSEQRRSLSRGSQFLKGDVELQVAFPHNYPNAKLQLFGRSYSLDRQQQLLLNQDLTAYIETFDPGELCVCAAIQWLRDNSVPYFRKSKLFSEPVAKSKIVKFVFQRMWIYSHQICRPELRKRILECAKRLSLTGFCLTGKPGVICVEGKKEPCEEFWHTIRYPNWKHISCKHAETVQIEGNEDELHLFKTFEELQFESSGNHSYRHDYHMDLGKFLEFLKKHQSGHIFQILFGIETKQQEN